MISIRFEKVKLSKSVWLPNSPGGPPGAAEFPTPRGNFFPNLPVQPGGGEGMGVEKNWTIHNIVYNIV